MSATDRRRAKSAALLTAGVAAGIIGAWTLSSNAQTPASTTNPASTTTSASPAIPGGGDHDGGHHGGRGDGRNGDETALTSAQTATLKAAALKHVTGGTVDRVETDSGDAASEVHMTNSSGKQVTVKFDKDLKFVAVEDGMGK